MTTSQALPQLNAVDNDARLRSAGYTQEQCTDCKGEGHHLIVAPNDASNWRRFACTRCEGSGVVWRAPFVR